jgi:rubrerythrin
MEDETVRHGRWEMKPDPYGFFDEIPVCSECGHTTKMRETYNYCPHCGAKMEVAEWLGE